MQKMKLPGLFAGILCMVKLLNIYNTIILLYSLGISNCYDFYYTQHTVFLYEDYNCECKLPMISAFLFLDLFFSIIIC